jgi:outer membrane protein W
MFPALIFAQPKITDTVKADTLPKPKVVKVSPKLRIGAQAGYGYRNAYITQSTYYSTEEYRSRPISNSMKNHLLKLNNNISYGADISYFIKDYIGFGLRYNGINARASSEVLFPLENESDVRGSLSEKIGIHYVGILIATRYFLPSQKHCLFANIGAGYVEYKNRLAINGYKHTIADDSAGIVAEFGYDFFVTKNVAIGLQASVFFGSQKYFSYIIDKENVTLSKSIRQPRRLNLNHLDISLGFRFYK